MIYDPITISKDDTVGDALALMKENKIGGIPVVAPDQHLIGIVTNRDLRFQRDMNRKIDEVMTKEGLVTTHNSDLQRAADILLRNKIEKLPVVDADGKLVGLITYKDITKVQDHPNACKDAKGRLRVAAGVGITPDVMDRVKALVDEDVDAVVLDTAHGHSVNVKNTLHKIKAVYPDLEVVVGNIATAEAAEFLISNGADGVKVGIGPGSICTTRVIAGVGVPQLSAIYGAASVARKYGIPVIADGGLRYSGDIVKALAAGGDCVMIGSMFAGTEEAPGETIIYNGRKFKSYRGKRFSSWSAVFAPVWVTAVRGTSRRSSRLNSSASPRQVCRRAIPTMLPSRARRRITAASAKLLTRYVEFPKKSVANDPIRLGGGVRCSDAFGDLVGYGL